MTEPVLASRFTGVRPALIGAVLGLLASVGLILLALTQGGGPEPASETLERVAVGVALVGPFVLSLGVVRFPVHVRAGVWIGAGIASLAIGVLSFALTMFVHAAAGILLLVGGGLAMSRARPGAAVALMAAVLVVGAGSLFARSITNDPQCWRLVRTGSGTEWREAEPQGRSGMTIALAPNEIEGRCTSEAMTPPEASAVFGAWAALAGVVVIMGRRRRPPDRPSPAAPLGAKA